MKGDSPPLGITLTPFAYWRLQWFCHRTPCEVSLMGLLAPGRGTFLIEDFILPRQRVSPTSVELDMASWADQQAELFEKRGVQPWQGSCWCHTHPAGINRPSVTDNDTMDESFGNWDFVIMLILTKEGVFYARIEFNHEFETGEKRRFHAECPVRVEWEAKATPPVTDETLAAWEAEFKERVRERPVTWLLDRTSRRGAAPKPHPTDPGKEVTDYEDDCASLGVDPRDPRIIEDYFGFVPEEFL